MGLDIEVGVLADLRENDLEGYEYFRNQFDLLNGYLERVGLPQHHEPENCEVWSCQMYGYSGLHYLRRIAAHIDLTGKLPPPGSEESAYDIISQNYYKEAERKKTGFSAGLLQPAPKYKFGFDHLILHNDDDGFYLPSEFEEVLHPIPEFETAGGGIGSTMKLLQECKRLALVLEIPSHMDEDSKELYNAVDSQGKGSTRWEQYGVESFSCVRLLKACQKSIETGAAIVFI